MPSQTQNRLRILVIRRRYVGDLVLMGPVFRNLRLHHPDAWLAVLVDEGYEDVLSRNPDVNEIIVLPRQSGARFLQSIRSRRFDVVYDVTRNDRSALIAIFSGAGQRVGFRVDARRCWRDLAYTTQAYWSPEDHQRCHIVDLYLKLLEANHVPVTTRVVEMAVASGDREQARRLIQKVLTRQQGDRLMIVHPGARAVARLWPAENFGAVCDQIQTRCAAKTLVMAGPNEQEFVAQVQSHARTNVAVIKEVVPIPMLAAMLAEADVFLGHDSGPMHIAAAVGTPVVALFGAQTTCIWGPRGERSVALQPPMPCSPCAFPDKCQPGNTDKMFCVRKIPVAQVLDAVEQQLRRSRA